MPINLYGKKGEEVSLTLRNVDVNLNGVMENKSLIYACNYKDITLDGVNIVGKLSSVVKKWSDGKITLQNVICDAKESISTATEPFFAHKV
jgi:membrane-bound inhibitor of C-type lysozyme